MPNDTMLEERLRNDLGNLGIDFFGVADITRAREGFLLDPSLRESFNRGLVLGRRLVPAVLDELHDSPTPLYLHHYRQVNYLLDRAALLVAGWLQEQGYRALPIAASQIIDWQRQRAHVPHKEMGRLAGLGWLGRNNLLINPDCGAQWRLVSLLTDAPLRAARPLDAGCGECRKCLTSCPAAAIKETREAFDHLACFEKLKEFRRSGIVSQYICGLCVKACSGRSRRPES